ncbi:MAG: hypothetical protein RSC28_08555 [Bacteroidales bacterium]
MRQKTKLIALLLLVFAASSVLTICAQESKAPVKSIVIVENFTRSREVPDSYLQTIRNNVINGFVHKGRFTVIDALTEASLRQLSEKRNKDAVEDDVNVDNVLDETRSAAFKSLGANFVITGAATQYTCTRSVKDGNVLYITKIYLSLKGYNIITGETMAVSQLELHGIGKTKNEADAGANSDANDKMNTYVNVNFPFETKILQLEEKKRGRLKELFIHCGTDIGVKRGDTFKVLLITEIAGIKSKKEIGRLRANEVAGEEVTKCIVTKGDAEILKAFNANKEMVVVSLGESLVAGLFSL